MGGRKTGLYEMGVFEVSETGIGLLKELAELEERVRKEHGDREAFGVAVAAAIVRQAYQKERGTVHE